MAQWSASGAAERKRGAAERAGAGDRARNSTGQAALTADISLVSESFASPKSIVVFGL